MGKKVLLISYRLGYNSLLYWDNLLIGIRNKYPNFRVFTNGKKLVTKDSIIATESCLKGLKIHYRKDHKNGFLFYFPLPFFLIRIIKYNPQIIIINEFNLNSLYIVLYKLFFKKNKILLLVESDPFLGYKNQHSKFRNFIRKFIVKHCDKILTNNQLGCDYLTEILDSEKDKINIAPYLVSIPPPTQNFKKIKSVDGKINFIYVGQLIQRKGLINVLKAFSKISEEKTNNYIFNIIGDGNELYNLMNYVKLNNLKNIFFLGRVNYDVISEYYHKADCFILNTFHDYRALVTFEAISSSCAIIGSKFDGARFETVHENLNGFIVDPYNVDDIKNAILKIIDDDTDLEEFKRYSKELSVNYNLERGIKNILKSIESLC